MASFVVTDAFVSVSAVDISAFVTAVDIEYNIEQVEDTGMGDTARTYIASYRNWTMTFELNQDFAASATDVTLWPLVGTNVALVLRPVKSVVVGVTNPEYRGTGTMDTYPPFSGSVGALAKTRVRFRSAGTLTRNTT